MSLIFYKQHFRNPSFKDTPECNFAHIRYIATRRGVMNNADMGHGLFGRLNATDELTDFESWGDAADIAKDLSKQKVNMFRSVISFRRDTAIEIGLKSQHDWKLFIKRHIGEIAKQNGIRIENFSFACAVHNEKQHPHCHIVFWDKSQEVGKNYTSPAIPNKIRHTIIKEEFADRIKEYFKKQYHEGNIIRKQMIKTEFAGALDSLYKEKDFVSSEIRNITEEMVAEFERYFKNEYPRESSALREVFETYDETSIDANLVYNCFNPEIISILGSRLLQLKEHMPKTGRLSYKLLPPEVKTLLDDYSDLLVKNNRTLGRLVNRYVFSKLEIKAMYSSNDAEIAAAKKQYKNEAHKIISNRVLSELKNILKDEAVDKIINNRSEYLQYKTQSMLTELYDLFSRLYLSDQRRVGDFNRMAMSNELSKKARKEYYLAHKDKEKSIER